MMPAKYNKHTIGDYETEEVLLFDIFATDRPQLRYVEQAMLPRVDLVVSTEALRFMRNDSLLADLLEEPMPEAQAEGAVGELLSAKVFSDADYPDEDKFIPPGVEAYVVYGKKPETADDTQTAAAAQ